MRKKWKAFKIKPLRTDVKLFVRESAYTRTTGICREVEDLPSRKQKRKEVIEVDR